MKETEEKMWKAKRKYKFTRDAERTRANNYRKTELYASSEKREKMGGIGEIVVASQAHKRRKYERKLLWFGATIFTNFVGKLASGTEIRFLPGVSRFAAPPPTHANCIPSFAYVSMYVNRHVQSAFVCGTRAHIRCRIYRWKLGHHKCVTVSVCPSKLRCRGRKKKQQIPVENTYAQHSSWQILLQNCSHGNFSEMLVAIRPYSYQHWANCSQSVSHVWVSKST